MRKIIHFFALLSVAITLIFVCSNSAEAQESPVDIKTNEKTVSLNIKENGDYYKVYKNDQLLYEGSSNEFKDELTEDIQKYKIGVFKEDKLKNILRVNVANPNPQQEQTQTTKSSLKSTKSLEAATMEQKVNSSVVESITNDKSVTLSWGELPDKDGIYEVYKNNEKIGETKSLTFTDNEVKPGEEYTYTIKVQTDLPQIDQQRIQKKLNDNNIKLNTEEQNEVFSINGSSSTIVKIPNNTETELNKNEELINTEDQTGKYSTKGIPKDNAYSFVYRTFIPYVSVKDPHPLGEGYLKGDNRSFATLSNKYRTESDMNVQFANPTSITHYKHIGMSHRCKDSACKKIIESKRASSSGLTHSVYKKSTSALSWIVDHQIAFPFGVSYPEIDYSYNAQLTKYKLKINGNHDGAPNHEFYLISPSGTRFIHSHSVKSKADFWKLLDRGLLNPWSLTM